MEDHADVPEQRRVWPNEWRCPRCQDVVGALSPTVLDVLCEMHVNEHKRQDRVWNFVKDQSVLELTPYDVRLLKTARIKVDEDGRE